MKPIQISGLTVKEIANGVNNIVEMVTKGIINVTTATRIITEDECGATFTLNKADGIAITLPLARVGLKYRVLVQTAVSGGDVVISCAGGDFFMGAYTSTLITAGTELFLFAGNGSTHNTFTMNGGTQGGSAGSYLTFTAISGTIWLVEGVVQCSDAQETSFSAV
jgi:hypothetical protein